MKIHFLQHVHFEGIGCIENWAKNKKFSVNKTRLFKAEALPNLDNIDLLIIMGGPMNVYEEDKYPWLALEKKFIKDAIKKNKKILGICLGAQLIADALGAKVYKNKHKEIGFFPITFTDEAFKYPFFSKFLKKLDVFHWHGDTFDLPQGTVRIASSEACKNQAFVYGSNIIGLQFHLEITKEGIASLVENCSCDIVKAPYVKSKEEILNISSEFIEKNINKYMTELLTNITVLDCDF